VKPLKALKSFLGNGVEVEVRDSLIPGAGKGLFLTKTGTNQKYITKGTMICLYDGVVVNGKENIWKYLHTQDGNDYIWQGQNTRRSYILVDAKDPESCYGRFSNEGFKKNNAEIIVSNLTEIAPRIVLRSTRRIYLDAEIYTGYGREYFLKDTHRTNPTFLAQAWEYYKITDPLPTITPSETILPENPSVPVLPQLPPIPPIQRIPSLVPRDPLHQVDIDHKNPRKRTIEELQKLLLSKKRQALKIQMKLELEIINIEEALFLFNK